MRAEWKLQQGRRVFEGSNRVLIYIFYERGRYQERMVSQHGGEASIMRLMVCMLQIVTDLRAHSHILPMTMACLNLAE